jgi:large subunit ribosomal protein L32
MPVPKRRTSKSRRDQRRTFYKLDKPALSVCPKCKQPKQPHHVCPHCGEYKGRKITEAKA